MGPYRPKNCGIGLIATVLGRRKLKDCPDLKSTSVFVWTSCGSDDARTWWLFRFEAELALANYPCRGGLIDN